MRIVVSSITIVFGLGLSALFATGHCAAVSAYHLTARPADILGTDAETPNGTAPAASGTCPVGDRSIRMFYSDRTLTVTCPKWG